MLIWPALPNETGCWLVGGMPHYNNTDRLKENAWGQGGVRNYCKLRYSHASTMLLPFVCKWITKRRATYPCRAITLALFNRKHYMASQPAK